MGMGIARRGRPPIGERAMTDAQRQRRRRWKLRASAPPVARTGQRQRPYDRIVTLWEQLREAWKRIDALKAECDWLAWNRKGRVVPSRPRRRYTGTCAPRCIPIAREIKARRRFLDEQAWIVAASRQRTAPWTAGIGPRSIMSAMA